MLQKPFIEPKEHVGSMDLNPKKTRDGLKDAVRSFSDLKKGWGGDNEDEITPESIATAIGVLDHFHEDALFDEVEVRPMRDGGVQIELGEFMEIEIKDNLVTEIYYDSEFNVSSTNSYFVKLPENTVEHVKA